MQTTSRLAFVTQADVDRYLDGGDPARNWLNQSDSPPPKRCIAWRLYRDLLDGGGLTVLDVGGGVSALTATLAARHAYTRCDLPDDWRDLPDRRYDVTVANDVFPNVDQGLDLFLTRRLGRGPLRMSLTVYTDRVYRARRLDGDEVLTVKAWGWPETRAVLERHGIPADLDPPTVSVFPNGRQVCLLEAC